MDLAFSLGKGYAIKKVIECFDGDANKAKDEIAICKDDFKGCTRISLEIMNAMLEDLD